MNTKVLHGRVFPNIVVNILICYFLVLQVFPPLWVQDVTSLRHFLICIFDVVCAVLFALQLKDKKSTLGSRNSVSSFGIVTPYIIWALLILWMVISTFWAINKVESIAQINRWLIIFFASFSLCYLMTNNHKIFHTLVYITIVIAFINILTCIIGYYYFDVYMSQRRNLYLNGGYGNKNIFAVCLTLKLPILYYVIIRYKKVWKIISLCLVFLTCFCLVIISTRSSFIAIFMQVVIILVYVMVEKLRLKRKFSQISSPLLIVIMVLCGFFVGNKFVEYNYTKYAAKDVKNNYTIAARVQTIEDGNSKGRLLIWRNTIETISKNPVWGYGVGNHKIAIMQVEAAKKTNYVVSDHAHNDFLEMWDELGIVGEGLYILLYVSTFVASIRLMWNRRTKEPYRLIALCSMLMLVTYMNDALFNFPLERATPQAYLALSIAMLCFAYTKSRTNIITNGNNIVVDVILVSFFVLIIPTTYIETTHFYSSIIQHNRILCHNQGNPDNIPASYWLNAAPWLPNLDESTKPIAINNASMFALEGNYRKAIDIILPDNSNPYYGLKEYRLASYYAHLKMMDSAFYWADRCMKMKPLCYDPVVIKASYYGRKGDKNAEIKIIKDYLATCQKEPRAYLDLINIYIKRGDYKNAMEVYKQSMVNNSDNASLKAKKMELDNILVKK